MILLFRLAWRYVVFHRAKSALLVLATALALLVPLAVSLLIDEYDRRLASRAEATPLVVGAPGNRFDLVLRALYFRPGRLTPVPYRLVAELRESGLGTAVPLRTRYTARGFPVVGTSAGYFERRGLSLWRGRDVALLGEAVIGSEVAARLGREPGEAIVSDPENVHDLASSAPLRMHIVGVLAPSGGPDDRAMFVDVRTAWVLEGLGHGHRDLAGEADEAHVLARDDRTVTASAALPTYVEITEENIADFHFHGDMSEYPLSAILVFPEDRRALTILANRINAGGEYQALEPAEVIAELMGLVFRIKRFFDATFALVAAAMLLLLALTVALSLRLRVRERETIRKLGGAPELVLAIQVAELAIVGAAALVLAGGAAVLLLGLVPHLGQWL